MTVNAQYNVAKPGSLPVKIAAHQRRKMFAAFLRFAQATADDTILDVGVTSDREYDHSNYLEAWYKHKLRITAAGIDDASFLAAEYPGVTFVRADGRRLPFQDCSLDFVHASAVLEHVGSRGNQTAFLREMWRVARKGIFVTTPNRWFPIEFHTILPLAHWLPAPLFRKALRALGKDFFAQESNLNLLSRRDLGRLATQAGIGCFDRAAASLLWWPTNLLLSGEKPQPPALNRSRWHSCGEKIENLI